MKTRDGSPPPASFRRHLHAQDASTWRADEPYIFMDVSDLEAERQVLLAALPHHPRGHAPTSSLGAAARDAALLTGLARFGEPPTSAELTGALETLPPSRSRALHARLEQLGRAIRDARRWHGRDYDPSRLAAVNPRWDRRWDALLGGVLVMAWLGPVPVERF